MHIMQKYISGSEGIRIKVRVDKGSNELKNQSSLRKNKLNIFFVLFITFSMKLKYFSFKEKGMNGIETMPGMFFLKLD